jgi:sugar-specific transcriptional regulator TrmB/DNA-binding CsgD family transcriptional regulator
MFEAAGISAAEERIYRLLVPLPFATAADIAAAAGLEVSHAEELLDSVVAQGLASRSERSVPVRYTATSPDVALSARIQQRTDALVRAGTAVTDLLHTYQDSRRRRDAGQLIEVVTGAEALRQHLRRIQDSAREELLWFCKADYVAMPLGANHAEFDALARGVRYRVLYESAFFDDPRAGDDVAEGVRAGEEARVISSLPLRLAIADRTFAVCPLVPGGPDGGPHEPTAALLRSSQLVEALIALFERYWVDGVPLRVDESGTVSGSAGGPEGDSLTAEHRRVLTLMVSGVADKAIASQLGLSKRTVQRRIQQLLALAGATSRVELAWCAARRNWI